MKLLVTNAYLGLLLLLFCSSCSCFSEDEEQPNQDNPAESIKATSSALNQSVKVEDSIPEAPEPVSIEEMDIDEESKNVLRERIQNSPFSEFDCCTDEATRFDNCCCEKVLKKYRELADKNELGDLNLIDQILIDCKKGKLSKQFEDIDFPDGDDYPDGI